MTNADARHRTTGELISLTGRVAVVTGAGRGLGLAIAHRLAESGAAVLLGDVNKASAEEGAAAITARGLTAIGASLDVTSPESIRDAVERAENELGPVDILVNNAGIFPSAPSLQLDNEEWRRVLGVNVDGAFYCTKEVGNRMAERGTGGVIVNLCSTASIRAPGPGLLAYATSKHALLGFTKCMAVELAPLGIRVLGVAPTLVVTPGIEEKKPLFEAAGIDIISHTESILPLGKIPTPDDVAGIVVFAASDLAASMTGSLLLADAGAMAL